MQGITPSKKLLITTVITDAATAGWILCTNLCIKTDEKLARGRLLSLPFPPKILHKYGFLSRSFRYRIRQKHNQYAPNSFQSNEQIPSPEFNGNHV